MDWSLYRCGRAGHTTYAPDEPHLRGQMSASRAGTELWQCLRCGAFVPGPPDSSGPAETAPAIKRGKQIRGDLILKLFSVERFLRFVLFGVVSYGVWHFANSKLTLTEAFNRELPAIRNLFNQIGFNLNHSSLLTRIRDLLHLSQTQLTVIAAGIAALAVVSLLESYALWQAKRWGEYFAMIVTSLGLPLEIYELTAHSVTATKVTLFVLNIGLVLYLVLSRRLFGARGGKHAYEARLRSESVIDEATKAAAAADNGARSIPATAESATVSGQIPPRP